MRSFAKVVIIIDGADHHLRAMELRDMIKMQLGASFTVFQDYEDVEVEAWEVTEPDRRGGFEDPLDEDYIMGGK